MPEPIQPRPDQIGVPTYDELMTRMNENSEAANRYLIQLGRTEEQLADAQARIAELEADIPPMPTELTLARVRIRALEDELKRRAQ